VNDFFQLPGASIREALIDAKLLVPSNPNGASSFRNVSSAHVLRLDAVAVASAARDIAAYHAGKSALLPESANHLTRRRVDEIESHVNRKRAA
jgi:hypothetical protein